MREMNRFVWIVRIWRDENAQDLIEYGLIAGFVALVVCSVLPDASILVNRVFSLVSNMMLDPSAGSSAQSS
jgi:Flp pilus assembly pilin Flp